jgi:hypothetical protein
MSPTVSACAVTKEFTGTAYTGECDGGTYAFSIEASSEEACASYMEMT